MKNITKSLVAATLLCGFTQAVQAIPVTGHIGIGAFASHAVIDKTANTVAFIDEDAVLGNAIVNQTSGSFAGLLGQFASYANFTYSPLSVSNPLWTLVLGGASFDLTVINSINEGGNGLVLGGTGVIHLAGFDDTVGTWSFSADSTSPADVNFSSTTTAAVPDGGMTVTLLGAALSSLGLIRRKLVA